MPDNNLSRELESGLKDAKILAQEIQDRVESGADIESEEMILMARNLAEMLEAFRARLENVVGPVDRSVIHEHMRAKMSPEEFEEWLAGEPDRLAFREEMSKVRAIKSQLEEGENG